MTAIVWDGNPNHLPPEGQEFIYEEKTFTWKRCDCGNPHCRRPLAYNTAGEVDDIMTIRIRGLDQGVPAATILAKLGRLEDLILAIKAKQDLNELFDRTLEDIEAKVGTADVEAYLASQGVTEGEYLASLLPPPPRELIALLSLLRNARAN